ncbi:hypothetical protein [Paenibacillus lutrae]|uniref:Uncharacterized protein n=1 Tax=Paenibacillus lutrae TaxID=2078573 RepID=A0A7X3FFA3_9BACL|nr:hypothetical protein [Paenibacillus lutrae]MVO98654.1 hypothetical protein [Paenibacillus lutrae]
MSNRKPSWYGIVKENDADKGMFTEKMKQIVIERVEHNRYKKMNHAFIKVLFPVAAAGLMLSILIVPLTNSWPAIFPLKQGGDSNGSMSPPGASGNDVTLNYEPAADVKIIPETDKAIRRDRLERIPLSSVTIKEVVASEGMGKYGKYVEYRKEGDPNPFFGYDSTNFLSSVIEGVYEIGYGALSDVKFRKSDAFGFSNVRLDGKCGPERRCTYWISQENNNIIANYQMDAATIYEEDLDGDGVTEAVVLTHDQDVYIYKNIAGVIKSIDVQAALQATFRDTVTYDPVQRTFQISSTLESRKYRYAAGMDKLELLERRELTYKGTM